MGRVLVILIAVFLLLTVLRNVMRNYQHKRYPLSEKKGNPNLKKRKDSDDDDNIADAKFEEIK